jgi:demethylmenaquinone methyltransferase/2-methoxy-6-polyprenyl-1,4-benzoquinol methylase
MSNHNLYIQRLLEAEPIREPLLRSVIESLRLPRGSRGLDAGCGIGLQMLLLAEATGAQVDGLDILPELLAYAAHLAGQRGFAGRVIFHQGDVGRLPFADDTFDWVWSADCIGYSAGDLQPVLAELVRVVKPGGRVILLGWSSQQILPGYPLLEARLNATCSAYLPFLAGKPPEQHFLRALPGFRQAGLEAVTAQTVVGSIQSPLTQEERTALTSLFDMLWGQPQPAGSPEDREAYQRLCQPGSAGFILDLPDYYGFFTYTLFQGSVPNVTV